MSALKEIPKEFEDISKEKNRGILKRVVKSGSAGDKPCTKDTCNVRYVGTYWDGEEDGKEFDRSDKFSFQLGQKSVITAWDVCVATMEIGEVCELIASPENCYNDGKSMKFEIELFSTKGQDVSDSKNESVLKSTLEEGDGIVNPPYGVQAKISFQKHGDSKPTELSYLIGDAEDSKLLVALDMAIRSMTQGEVAKVEVKQGDKSVIYQVKLFSFEKIKHLNSFDNFVDKMKYTETLKEKANSHFKACKFFLAIQTYKRIYSDLEFLVTDGPEESKQLDAVKIVILNNSALAYLKMNDCENAIKECEKSLELDLKNEKALFRLGQAFLNMNDHEEALSYFKKCAHYHQGNVDALKMNRFCEDKIQKAKQMEKARFRGIFNRLKDTGLGIQEPEPEPISEDNSGGSGASSNDDGEQSESEKEPVKEAA